MSLVAAFALLLLQQPAPSAAAGASAPAATPASAAKPAKAKDADPVVCEEDNSTGSIMPKRVCKHMSEWKAQEQNFDDGFRRQMGPQPR